MEHETCTEPVPGAKSRLAAGLLGIFLGSLGVHNFYLGRYGRAWFQLLITLLSLGTLGFISAIWGIAEGVLYLTGRRSIPESEQTPDRFHNIAN